LFFHLVENVDGFLAGSGTSLAAEFLSQPYARAFGGHFFVPQQLFDALYDSDIPGFVEPPVRSIASWFQLWKPAFPLSEHVGRNAGHVTNFGYPVAPVFKLGDHTQSRFCIATSA